jgi:plasmid stabilization system protein ParE
MKIKWSPLSAERLADIVNHISKENPDAARKTAENIFTSIENLNKFPNSGRVVPELDDPKYREILVGNYRVVYSVLSDAINVLTIRHQKQLLKLKNFK